MGGSQKHIPWYSLNHDRPEIFVEPQYGGTRMWYLIYRMCVALCLLALAFVSWSTFFSALKWPIYLTHWSFSVLTLDAVLQAACVVRHSYLTDHLQAEKHELVNKSIYTEMPFVFKLFWVLHNISIAIGPVVTAMFWAIIYNPSNGSPHFPTIGTHVINSAYVMIDSCVSGVPVRVTHVYQVLVYGLVYVVFSVVYWLTGGTGEDTQYIYKVLDYNEHLQSLSWISGVLVIVVLAHLFMYGVYRMRVYAYDRLKSPTSASHTMDNMI